MIYQKLIVTDQSYEVPFQDINFVPCPTRFSCPAQGWYKENKSIRENWQVKMFAVAGYHAVVCDAFIYTLTSIVLFACTNSCTVLNNILFSC